MIIILLVLVTVLWIIIGVYRYIEYEGDDGTGVDPDLYGYSWYTILIHGPFWWLVKIGVVMRDFLSKQDWSWFERLFSIKKKGDNDMNVETQMGYEIDITIAQDLIDMKLHDSFAFECKQSSYHVICIRVFNGLIYRTIANGACQQTLIEF